MMNAFNAKAGVCALAVIVLSISAVVYCQVEAMRQEFDEEVEHWMEAEVASYYVKGDDVEFWLYFKNVSKPTSGHLEIRSEYLFVENRSVVAYEPFTVELVNDFQINFQGDNTFPIVVEDIISNIGQYRIWIRYIGKETGLGVTRILDFEPVYIL